MRKFNLSDFRIGNYVAQGNDLFIIDAEDMAEFIKNGIPDDIYSVLLGDKTFIRFGFTKIKFKSYDGSEEVGWEKIFDKEFEFTMYEEDKKEHMYSFRYNDISSSFNTAHQLQNLYHSLSGQELTFKFDEL